MPYQYDRTKFKTAKDIADDADVAPSTITRWLDTWATFYAIPDPVAIRSYDRYTIRLWTFADAATIKHLYFTHRANYS